MASFGENLRRERELRGVDLREIADATKISIRFLHAIEEDRAEILPGGIFAKAFVRQYARYLGLDSDRLVAEFVFAHGGDSVPLRGPRPEVRVDQGGSRGLVVAAVAIGLLGLVGWRMWGPGRRAAHDPAVAASTTAPTTFPEDRVFPPPSSTVAGPALTRTLAVALTAQRSSWVEVRIDGTTMLSRTMSQGETQRFEARHEVVLSLGNAGGVAVTVNGKPLAPLGREGDVKKNIVIDAQTLPALLPAGTTGAVAGAPPSARPSPRARPSSPPASPAPSELPLMPVPGARALAPVAPPSPVPER